MQINAATLGGLVGGLLGSFSFGDDTFLAEPKREDVSEASTPFAEFFASGFGEVAVEASELVHGAQGAGADTGVDEGVEGFGPEPLVLDVGRPGTGGLLARFGHVVSALDRPPVVKATLGPLEDRTALSGGRGSVAGFRR